MGLVLPLDSSPADPALCGGKGANLASLLRAGFQVPGGFIVTTDAYGLFLAHNDLQPRILERVRGLEEDVQALEGASAEIRGEFRRGTLPAELAAELRTAYLALGNSPVAVRSSATAEDLPELSFAGQQDTFLNIIGEAALREALIDCFGSLWTARALGYRIRNGIAHEEVQMAVVVQEMAASEASGVLFTANPLTGRRSETVIDAVLGLGEALVSGRVEPDHYVVTTATGEIIEQRLGAKTMAILPREGGGTVDVAHDAGQQQAISDDAIKELAELGRRIAALFAGPQDVEWAQAGDMISILQARPITSLFPLPEGSSPARLEIFFSFAAVQGMTDPMTPLGRDFIAGLFAGLARNGLGYGVTPADQRALLTAAERLWANITPLARNRLAGSLWPRILAIAEPGAAASLAGLRQHPELAGGLPKPGTLFRLLRFFLPLAAHILLTMLMPERQRVKRSGRGESEFARIAERIGVATTLADITRVIEEVEGQLFPAAISCYVPLIAGGMAGLGLLNRLAREVPGGRTLALSVTRGLPHNVTTEMDLALWHVAAAVRQDPASSRIFREQPVEQIVDSLRAGALPPVAGKSLGEFLERYGMRGVGEIDLGRRRWDEAPEALIETLRMYLEIKDADHAPAAVFERGAGEAAAALEELAGAVRKRRFGRVKAHMVRVAGRRVRTLAGYRESPKFLIVRTMGLLRRRLLAEGEKLVRRDALTAAADIFFLHQSEQGGLAAGQEKDWAALVNERKLLRAREMRRRRIPRLLLSDGTAFYEGSGGGDGDLSGTPVSPGTVEGRVQVVLQPHRARLSPGDILVCVGTDPAWTPLFLAAGGLITEVGGMMTHGSVVAREYGIPAVVGVQDATTRLHSGQRIRLDGTNGSITLLTEEATPASA